MIDHLGIDVSDLDRSRRFYAAALAPLGLGVVAEEVNDAGGRVVMFGKAGAPEFVIAEDRAPGVGTHIAFRAAGRAEVDAFHAAALSAGGRTNGPPALRPAYGPNYYAAFVLDPDGLNIEAVCHSPS